MIENIFIILSALPLGFGIAGLFKKKNILQVCLSAIISFICVLNFVLCQGASKNVNKDEVTFFGMVVGLIIIFWVTLISAIYFRKHEVFKETDIQNERLRF